MAAQAHPPVDLTFAANNWQAWAIGIEDVGREIEGSPFNQLLAAIKGIERPAPASHPYSTARKNFTYDRTLKMWIQTDQFGRHNTIGLEEFLEDPLIQPLVEDPSIVYGINYMNKRRGGQRIEEADAFEAVVLLAYRRLHCIPYVALPRLQRNDRRLAEWVLCRQVDDL